MDNGLFGGVVFAVVDSCTVDIYTDVSYNALFSLAL